MIKAQVTEIEGNILNIFMFALVKCWQYKKKNVGNTKIWHVEENLIWREKSFV